MPGVTLTAVGFDNVTISRGGAPEQIFLDQSHARAGRGRRAAAPPAAPAPAAPPPAPPRAGARARRPADQPPAAAGRRPGQRHHRRPGRRRRPGVPRRRLRAGRRDRRGQRPAGHLARAGARGDRPARRRGQCDGRSRRPRGAAAREVESGETSPCLPSRCSARRCRRLRAQHVLNLRDADIRAFIQDAARVTGRTFIIDPAVQGRVSVVTQRPLSRSEYFELFLSTMRANGFVAVPIAGRRAPHPAGRRRGRDRAGRRPARAAPSGFVTEIFRVRHIEAAAGGRDAAAAGQPRRLDHRQPQLDRRLRLRRQCRAGSARCWPGSTSTPASTRDRRPRQCRRARDRRGALAELAPEGVSVVPVDSSNAIAFRGDGAAVARLIEIAAGARPARRERQRDPGRLPPACRCRAIAAGAAAAARPGADPAGRRRSRARRGAAQPATTARRRRRPASAADRAGAGAPPRRPAARRLDRRAQRGGDPLRGRQRDRHLGDARRPAHAWAR